jgi:NitT/TauT family transport system substrate-binding protein
MRRTRIAFSSCLLVLGTVTACSAAGAGSSGPYHLRVYAQTVVDDAPFFIALREGFFKDEGLDVSYVPLPKTTLGLSGLASGAYPILIGGNYPTMLQADEGIPAQGLPGVPAKAGLPAQPPVPANVIAALTGQVRVLVEGYSGAPNIMTLVTLPSSNIRTPEELSGRRVAVNLVGGIQTLTLNEVLRTFGVDPASIRYVQVPFPAMVKALQAHQVDAADMLEPYLTEAEVQVGAAQLVDQLSGPTNDLPISGVFTTAAFVRAHPQVAMEFQRVMLRAQAVADDDRLAVEQALVSYIPVTPGTLPIKSIAPAISLGVYPTVLDPIPLQRVADLMLAQHLLTSRLDVSTLLYNPDPG